MCVVRFSINASQVRRHLVRIAVGSLYNYDDQAHAETGCNTRDMIFIWVPRKRRIRKLCRSRKQGSCTFASTESLVSPLHISLHINTSDLTSPDSLVTRRISWTPGWAKVSSRKEGWTMYIGLYKDMTFFLIQITYISEMSPYMSKSHV